MHANYDIVCVYVSVAMLSVIIHSISHYTITIIHLHSLQ